MVGILDVLASTLGVFSALEEGGEAMVDGGIWPLMAMGDVGWIRAAFWTFCRAHPGVAFAPEAAERRWTTRTMRYRYATYRRQHADSVLTIGRDALLALREVICLAFS